MKLAMKTLELGPKAPQEISMSKGTAETPPEALFDELLAGMRVEQPPQAVVPPPVRMEQAFEADGLSEVPKNLMLRVAAAPAMGCKAESLLGDLHDAPEPPAPRRVSGPPGPLLKPMMKQELPQPALPSLPCEFDDLVATTPKQFRELSVPFAAEASAAVDATPATDRDALEAPSELNAAPHLPQLPAQPTESAKAVPNLPTATRVHQMAEPAANSAALLAVNVNTEQHTTVSLSHPQLGDVALQMHKQQGCLEVTAVLQTEAAATVVKSQEHGMRKGAERGGLTFSGLKVRVDGDTSERNPESVKRGRKTRGRRD